MANKCFTSHISTMRPPTYKMQAHRAQWIQRCFTLPGQLIGDTLTVQRLKDFYCDRCLHYYTDYRVVTCDDVHCYSRLRYTYLCLKCWTERAIDTCSAATKATILHCCIDCCSCPPPEGTLPSVSEELGIPRRRPPLPRLRPRTSDGLKTLKACYR